MSIDDLGLSVRSRNILKRAGYDTVEDASNMFHRLRSIADYAARPLTCRKRKR